MFLKIYDLKKKHVYFSFSCFKNVVTFTKAKGNQDVEKKRMMVVLYAKPQESMYNIA